MNVLYAIKDRKTGLYYSRTYARGLGWWSELTGAVLYKSEDGAQRIIDGNAVSPVTYASMRKGDPYIVPIQLTEMAVPYSDVQDDPLRRDYEEECPECKKATLRGKELYEGGGVVCRNKECGYWFCY